MRSDLPLYAPIFKTREEAEAFTWRGLEAWQDWLFEWYHKNFAHVPMSVQAAKLMEEAGELGHAVVRLWFLERRHYDGGAEALEVRKYKDELRNAIGDVVVVATTLARYYGWRLADILREVQTELDAREYNETKTDHQPPKHTHRYYSGDSVAPVPRLREVCEQGRCPPRYQK